MKRIAVTSALVITVVLLGVMSFESNGQIRKLAAQQEQAKVPFGQNERDLPLIGEFKDPGRQKHANQLHVEIAHLEVEQMRREVMMSRVELFKQAEVVAMMAVDHSVETMEPNDAVDFLTGLQKDIKNPIVARYVRMKLVEVNTRLDNSRAVKEQLRELIISH
ncbi:MAG: hypothetical protein O3A00_21850 [Planctomycetota bacterium]|nr:hypothetical protein [Planctomycetota bacterium]